ncbi:MAG: GNAT family N-acetyltransferase [Opitutaceae bacterium]|jgi:GNAT superfamily N-acetyltransferase|nr:GNAT family N-acetyltransferase [Opitutaceae bacterium]
MKLSKNTMTSAPEKSTGPLRWTEAAPGDEAAIIALMRDFYAEDKITFRPGAVREGVRALLASPAAGRLFLLRRAAAGAARDDDAASGPPLGHLALTFCFSMEFHGRFVLLDELYIAPSARGAGLANAALRFAAGWARGQGARAVRLEVNAHNARVRPLYAKHGFADDHRDLFTRWLD